MELTEKDKQALRGELNAEEFKAHGMQLLKKGMVAIDPLGDGPAAFILTDLGRRTALELRATTQRYEYETVKLIWWAEIGTTCGTELSKWQDTVYSKPFPSKESAETHWEAHPDMIPDDRPMAEGYRPKKPYHAARIRFERRVVGFRDGYQGPIESGMQFVWEPNNPRARKVIVVEKITPETRYHEARVFSAVPNSVSNPVWNDESRFREAVIPLAIREGSK